MQISAKLPRQASVREQEYAIIPRRLLEAFNRKAQILTPLEAEFERVSQKKLVEYVQLLKQLKQQRKLIEKLKDDNKQLTEKRAELQGQYDKKLKEEQEKRQRQQELERQAEEQRRLAEKKKQEEQERLLKAQQQLNLQSQAQAVQESQKKEEEPVKTSVPEQKAEASKPPIAFQFTQPAVSSTNSNANNSSQQPAKDDNPFLRFAPANQTKITTQINGFGQSSGIGFGQKTNTGGFSQQTSPNGFTANQSGFGTLGGPTPSTLFSGQTASQFDNLF